MTKPGSVLGPARGRRQLRRRHEVRFRLHPLGPEVFAGLVLHRPERGRELLRLWRDVMREAPDELSLAFGYLGAPDEPEIPEHLRGKPAADVAGMYAGPIAEGEEALRAIREFGPPDADFFGRCPFPRCSPRSTIRRVLRNYWTAEYVADLPDETLDRIATRGEDKPIPFGQVFCVAWGGAVPRVPEGDTPLTGRDAKFIIHPLVLWEDPADEAAIAWGRGFRDDVADVATGHLHQLRRRGWRRPGEGGVRAEPRAAGADQGRVGSSERVPGDGICRLLPRIEQALRVEGPLDLVKRAGGLRGLEREPALLHPPDPVLAGHRAPEPQRGSNSSSAADRARSSPAASSGATRNVECRLPSPACPQLHASSSWRRPIATVSSIASRRRSIGTTMSSLTFRPAAP